MPQKIKHKTAVPDFEKSLKQLETIVAQLERGDDSLEDSLRRFEEGITLSRQCQEALKHAEQRVQLLVSDNEGVPDHLEAMEVRDVE